MQEMTRYNKMDFISHPASATRDEKIEIFEQALEQHPERLIDIAYWLVSFLQYDIEHHHRCIELGQKVISATDNPDTQAEMHYVMGNSYYDTMHNIESGKNHYLLAHKLSPDHDSVLSALISIAIEQHDFDKGAQWALHLISIHPNSPNGYNQLGDVHFAAKNIEQAIEAYQRVLAMAPNNHNALYGMGRCYAQEQQHQKALKYFLSAWECIDPPNPSYAYCAGLCYQNIDDPYRALMWYTKALERWPTFPEALNNMAAVSQELSNGWEEAVPYLHKAVELNKEAVSKEMRPIYRNLWAYYKNILDHEKAEYYQRLHYKCMGLEDLLDWDID